MRVQDCLAILRDIKDVAFATVDAAGKPQVRIIDVMIVEGEKLYFCTARGKDFYRQLIARPDVAITGLNKDFQMVRLMGKAKKLDEQKVWMDRIFDENPVMNDVYPGESRYILEPFCLEEGEVEFFDLGKQPIQRERFLLSKGSEEEVGKGFLITDACIGCGTCARVCPQQCIEEGMPYRIRQTHCLHCGLCFESCPVQAIERKGA